MPLRHAACNRQLRDNMRHAAGNMQRTTNDMHRATGNMRQTPSNRQHATGNVQHATGNVEIWKRTLATGHKPTSQQANKPTSRQTPRRRRQNQATHATDNVQQTADDMQEHASTCEMQQGNTRHRRLISCAASGGQRTTSSMREALSLTTSAEHGTDATHKMRHTTRAAQHAANTRGTGTTQQALNRTR
jgi:hypothetical protein